MLGDELPLLLLEVGRVANADLLSRLEELDHALAVPQSHGDRFHSLPNHLGLHWHPPDVEGQLAADRPRTGPRARRGHPGLGKGLGRLLHAGLQREPLVHRPVVSEVPQTDLHDAQALVRPHRVEAHQSDPQQRALAGLVEVEVDHRGAAAADGHLLLASPKLEVAVQLRLADSRDTDHLELEDRLPRPHTGGPSARRRGLGRSTERMLQILRVFQPQASILRD
mmetsp:Transcript_32724/g.79608  ORF Transcript_32724/g.79608 Transcript_32724/m.79608 type:complete len:224 (-) Transcript_32724:353-1024(-)